VDFLDTPLGDLLEQYQDNPEVTWFINHFLRGSHRFPIVIEDIDNNHGLNINIEDNLGSEENPIVID
jgi:hypothetical protein